MAITSIQVESAVREALAALKSSPRETYSEVLLKLLSLVPQGDDEGAYSDAFRVGLLSARLDVQAGRTLPHDELKQRLGL
jgi:hypothetical protein